MAAAPPFGFHPNILPAVGYNNSAGLQLVPYQPTPQKQSNENLRQPLTAEQLSKLYSMNYAVQPHRSNLPVMNAGAVGRGIVYGQTASAIGHQPSVYGQSVGSYASMPIQHQAAIPPNPFSQLPVYMPAVTAVPQQSISMPLAMPQIGLIPNSAISTLPQLPPRLYSQLPSLSSTSDAPSTSSGAMAENQLQADVVRRKKKPGPDLIDLGNGIDDKYVIGYSNKLKFNILNCILSFLSTVVLVFWKLSIRC